MRDGENWNAAANSSYLDQERDPSVRDISHSAVILSALCLPSRLDLIDLFSFSCEIFSDSDWSVLFCGRRTVDTICFSSDDVIVIIKQIILWDVLCQSFRQSLRMFAPVMAFSRNLSRSLLTKTNCVLIGFKGRGITMRSSHVLLRCS